MNKLDDLRRQVVDVGPRQSPIVTLPRSTANPETSHDLTNPDPDAPIFSPFKTGIRRQTWNTPINAIHSAVVSIKKSATPTQGSQDGAYQAGLLASPITTLSTLSVIPDLSVPLQSSGPVLVQMNGTFSAPASATLNFALFRDGQLISRSFPHVSTGSPSIINIQVLDQPVNGSHTYDARWSTSSGTATAVGLARAMQAMNLRAQ